MVYDALRFIFRFIYCVVFKFKIIGLENIPAGGSLLCANHQSNWDPITLGIALPKRHVRFMAKKELFKNPVLRKVLNAVYAFPVDRSGTDMQSFKTGVSLLKDGHIMGIFPQGTRMKVFEETSAKSGFILLAQKSSTPVIPVSIKSTYKLFSPVVVTIGKPIAIDTTVKLRSENMAELAIDVMKCIKQNL